MDIILHLGAHRSATVSFQAYLASAQPSLAAQGVVIWGPHRTRAGLFHGLPEHPSNSKPGARAAGRLRLMCSLAAKRGARALLVSDAHMIGSRRLMLARGVLYPQIGERMARFHHAFGGPQAGLRRVVLQIRSLDLFWASCLAHALPRGAPLPTPAQLDDLAQGARSWRHVLRDLACAMPGVEVIVTPFERFAAHPDRLLHQMTPAAHPPAATAGQFWCNRAPDIAALRGLLADRAEDVAGLTDAGTEGRWMPFTPPQAAQLRAVYAEDLNWLRAGAEGLARYVEEPDPEKTRRTWPPGLLTRGQDAHDIETTGVAHPR